MRSTSFQRSLFVTVLIAVGCGGEVLEFEQPDSATGGETSAPPTAGAGGTQSVAGSTGGVSLCAGKQCASHELCCLLDGSCFDPSAAASACPTPAPDDSGPRCGSNADCAANEFCESHLQCLGPGTCVERTNCGTSSGMPWCGCDGITYPDKQTSCLSGVRIATQQGCGLTHSEGGGGSASWELIVTGCGHDDQCPAGEQCCYITGRCFDPAHPVLCSFPPEGTRASCESNFDCYPSEYCKGPSCGAPGGCVSVPGSGSCTGVMAPVCGCDGQSYVNADCAAVAGVVVDHGGACP